MQRSIVHKRPQRGMCDRLEWIGAPFLVRGAYKRLCEGQSEEYPSFNKACRFIWQPKVPLKVGLFSCLLLWKRLMTKAFHIRLYPETSAECGLCLRAEEDYAQLFFGCPFARSIWDRQTILRVDTTPETSFWKSIQGSRCRRRADGFGYSRCSGPYSYTGMTSCSMGGKSLNTM